MNLDARLARLEKAIPPPDSPTLLIRIRRPDAHPPRVVEFVVPRGPGLPREPRREL